MPRSPIYCKGFMRHWADINATGIAATAISDAKPATQVNPTMRDKPSRINLRSGSLCCTASRSSYHKFFSILFSLVWYADLLMNFLLSGAGRENYWNNLHFCYKREVGVKLNLLSSGLRVILPSCFFCVEDLVLHSWLMAILWEV